MSSIKIEFNIDNAAFEDDLPGEVLQIFHEIHDNLGELADTGELRIRDSNGNTIGKAEVK